MLCYICHISLQTDTHTRIRTNTRTYLPPEMAYASMTVMISSRAPSLSDNSPHVNRVRSDFFSSSFSSEVYSRAGGPEEENKNKKMD